MNIHWKEEEDEKKKFFSVEILVEWKLVVGNFTSEYLQAKAKKKKHSNSVAKIQFFFLIRLFHASVQFYYGNAKWELFLRAKHFIYFHLHPPPQPTQFRSGISFLYSLSVGRVIYWLFFFFTHMEKKNKEINIISTCFRQIRSM